MPVHVVYCIKLVFRYLLSFDSFFVVHCNSLWCIVVSCRVL